MRRNFINDLQELASLPGQVAHAEAAKQKLVDIMMELVMRLQNGDLRFETPADAAAYVRHQLEQCGFPTQSRGSSWAVLL